MTSSKFRSAAVVALALALVPTPTPAQELPGDGPIPKEVISLLRKNQQRYGEDATILQGILLAHSVDYPALLTSESGIEGFEEVGDERFVRYRLSTGILLNDRDLDLAARIARIWHALVERSLVRYKTFDTVADGVTLQITYRHGDFSNLVDVSYSDVVPGIEETAVFRLRDRDVAQFAEGKIAALTLLTRAMVEVEGVPFVPSYAEPGPLPAVDRSVQGEPSRTASY